MRRSSTIDALRGAAMTAVVLAHAVQRNIGPDAVVFQYLASFEMPLFALVSGYLLLPPTTDVASWLRTKALRLLVPFLAWAPVLWFMSRFYFTGLDVVGIPQSLGVYVSTLIARPEDGLWYLLTLFQWSVVMAMAASLLSRSRRRVEHGVIIAMLAVIAMILLTRRALPLGNYGLAYFLDLVPFFAGGTVLRLAGFELGSSELSGRRIIGVSSMIGAAALLVGSPTDALSPFWLFVLDVIIATLGVIGVTFAVQSLHRTSVTLRVLAMLGRSSIGIYAAHLVFLRVGPGTGWTKAITTAFAAVIVSLVVTRLLRLNRMTALIFLGERGQTGPRTTENPEEILVGSVPTNSILPECPIEPHSSPLHVASDGPSRPGTGRMKTDHR